MACAGIARRLTVIDMNTAQRGAGQTGGRHRVSLLNSRHEFPRGSLLMSLGRSVSAGARRQRKLNDLVRSRDGGEENGIVETEKS